MITIHSLVENYMKKRGFTEIRWYEGQNGVVICAKQDGNSYCMKATDIVNTILRVEARKK